MDTITATAPYSGAILIVDDEPNITKALKRCLHTLGHQIYIANDANQALMILAEQPIQVIISDMRMPEVNGAEFFARSRQLQPDCRRILLTGYADVDSINMALAEGRIHHYLYKPWEPTQLQLLVAEAMAYYYLQLENNYLDESMGQLLQQVDKLKN